MKAEKLAILERILPNILRLTDTVYVNEEDVVVSNLTESIQLFCKKTAGVFEKNLAIYSGNTLQKGLNMFTNKKVEFTTKHVNIFDLDSNSKFAAAIGDHTAFAEVEKQINEFREAFVLLNDILKDQPALKVPLTSADLKFMQGIARDNKINFINFSYKSGDKVVKIELKNSINTIDYKSELDIDPASAATKDFSFDYEIGRFIDGMDWDMYFIEDNALIFFDNEDYQVIGLGEED
jgi:hypothetical protein